MEDFSDELLRQLSRVNWDTAYSDLVRQVPHVFAGPSDPNRWARGYAALPSQQGYHELGYRFKGFSGPVGSGKSFALAREAIRLAYANPGCDGLLGSQTYRTMRDVTRKALFRELRKARVKYEYRASDNVVYIRECRSEIALRAMSEPDKLVGTNLAWFGVDELTFCPRESWENLEARLRDKSAHEPHGFAVWTPRGFDWVWNNFINPDTRLPGYGCICAKPGENKINLQDGYYEGLQRSYDPRYYQQQVEGIYLNIFTGQAYYGFSRYGTDRASNIQERVYDPALPICWSLDFNVARMSSIIAQYKPVPGEDPEFVRVIDEIWMPDSNTSAVCDEFLYRLDRITEGTGLHRGLVNVRVYGDAAGEARSSKASKTDYQLIRDWAARNSHRVSLTMKVPESNPPVRDRIASVNGMLYNAAHETRLTVNGACHHLIEDLEQVGWALDKNKNYTGELDKSKAHLTHMSDALGYFIWSIAPIRQRGGPRSSTTLRF